MADTVPCGNCSVPLQRASCGCWVDSINSRWCAGGKTLHAPEGHIQPERCGRG